MFVVLTHFEIQNFQMTPNGKKNPKKVVDPDNTNKFLVKDFFIGNH
jgi:hypothetical protein